MAKCHSCGRENPEGYSYCANCGAIVLPPTAIDEKRLSDAKTAIRLAIEKRASTDKFISPVWAWALVVLNIAMIIVVIAVLLSILPSFDESEDPGAEEMRDLGWAMLATMGPLSAVYYIFLAYLAYSLVKRQNDHYARERELRAGVVSLTSAMAGSPERANLLQAETYSMMSAGSADERYRSPLLWAIINGFPIVLFIMALVIMTTASENISGLVLITLIAILPVSILTIVFAVLTYYMFYFLGKTMYEHDGRWQQFAFNARRGLTRLGAPQGSPYETVRLPERSFVLYLVLALFIPFFTLYWWYALIKDPNEHFRMQRQFEDHLLSVTGQQTAPASSASPP